MRKKEIIKHYYEHEHDDTADPILTENILKNIETKLFLSSIIFSIIGIMGLIVCILLLHG